MSVFVLAGKPTKFYDGSFSAIPTFTFYPKEEMMSVTGVAGADMCWYTHNSNFCTSHRKTGLETYKGKKFAVPIQDQREIYLLLFNIHKCIEVTTICDACKKIVPKVTKARVGQLCQGCLRDYCTQAEYIATGYNRETGC